MHPFPDEKIVLNLSCADWDGSSFSRKQLL